MKIAVSVGNSRMDKKWNLQVVELDEFSKRLSQTTRTAETVAQYRKLAKAKQDDIKDVGGFVLGRLKNGRRKKDCVESRSALTLDMDHGPKGIIEEWEMLCTFRCIIYSTHKHTAENPRLRFIIPLTRDVSADEYGAISRKVAATIGIEMFDDTTYEPSRLMYWPSTSADGEYFYEDIPGPLLNPDTILAMYADWHDVSSWPISQRAEEIVQHALTKQADPLTKTGIVGAFCRTYSMTDVIEVFLGDVYHQSEMPGRYDYIHGEGQAGLVVYEDKWAYSHHATDPCCGKLLNAFDIVRIHLFGSKDHRSREDTETTKLPSFKAMQALSVADAAVSAVLLEDKKAEAEHDFAEDENWEGHLQRDKNGKLINNLHNITLILERDEPLQNIVFNELADGMEIKGDIPWKHPARFWRDADDAQLICYVDSHYGTFSARNYDIAVTKVTDDRSYHPIREFLDSLPPWDGTSRVETFLIDYLGAEDTEYVRAVTRKTLCAAVARVQHPGIKFDYILVLNGTQGLGKSMLIAKLGGEWYSDSLALTDMNDKTAAEKLQGYWILEIGELAGMKKADIDKVKAFISRQDDKYRASFGRRVTPHPRQCVIFGTTNSDNGYLRDITGNRRFWTVRTPGTGKYHPWELTADTVRQLWAETLQLVASGEKLYLDENLERYARREQNAAMERDEREGLVRVYLDTLLPETWDSMDLYQRQEYMRSPDGPVQPIGVIRREEVCNMEIWCECFCRYQSDLRPCDSYAIAAIMARIEGWEKAGQFKSYVIYGKQRVYNRTTPGV